MMTDFVSKQEMQKATYVAGFRCDFCDSGHSSYWLNYQDDEMDYPVGLIVNVYPTYCSMWMRSDTLEYAGHAIHRLVKELGLTQSKAEFCDFDIIVTYYSRTCFDDTTPLFRDNDNI